jgi:2-polyprenyl-3-methyl-5-hydroxy-6-metoxy-1,4-benzoquinol methylase
MASHPIFKDLRERYGKTYNMGKEVGFLDADRRGYAGPGHWEHTARWADSAAGILGAASALMGETPGSVLDVGCGRGAMVQFLAGGGVRAAGVDIGLDFRAPRCAQANALALPFADLAFDVVVALDMVEHVPDELQGALLRELARVAGRLILATVPTRAPQFRLGTEAGPRNHYLCLAPEEWRRHFQDHGLEVLASGYALLRHGVPFSHGADNWPIALLPRS